MLVTGPIIGKLLARPRLWAYRRMKAGDFGPPIKGRGRALCVHLEKVQEKTGQRFSQEQLAVALGADNTQQEVV